MALAFKELLGPWVKKQILADLLTLLQAAGLTTTTWQPGSQIYDLLDTIVGWVCDSIWNSRILPVLQAPFLDFAAAPWVDIIGWTGSFVGSPVSRKRLDATFATATLTIENRGGGSYLGGSGIVAGQIRVKNAAGKTFTNTTGGDLPAWTGSGAYPTLDLVFSADELGTRSNTLASGIAAYPTPLVSGPPNVYAQTNAAPAIGTDQETIPAYVRRLRAAITELAPQGVRETYASIAFDPASAFTRRKKPIPASWGTSGAPNVNRFAIPVEGGGTIVIVLASPAGAASGTDVSHADTALQLFARPPGSTLTTESATEHEIDLGTITLTIDRDSLVTVEEATAAGIAQLTDPDTGFFPTLPIGGARKVPGATGYVYRDAVVAALKMPGLKAIDLAFTDELLGPAEVAVPVFSLVAVLVSQQ